MYEESSYAQATHVTGLVNLLLKLRIIDTPWYYSDDFPHIGIAIV